MGPRALGMGGEAAERDQLSSDRCPCAGGGETPTTNETAFNPPRALRVASSHGSAVARDADKSPVRWGFGAICSVIESHHRYIPVRWGSGIPPPRVCPARLGAVGCVKGHPPLGKGRSVGPRARARLPGGVDVQGRASRIAQGGWATDRCADVCFGEGLGGAAAENGEGWGSLSMAGQVSSGGVWKRGAECVGVGSKVLEGKEFCLPGHTGLVEGQGVRGQKCLMGRSLGR